jgi:hypothetical protein
MYVIVVSLVCLIALIVNPEAFAGSLFVALVCSVLFGWNGWF